MAWLTTSELREKFNIQSGRFETQIESAIVSAALVIQRSVEADVYAEAIDDPPDPITVRYSSVLEAHSYLAMWYLVGNVGNRLSEQGFVKAQQDSSSPGQGSRIVTNSYLTPKEISTLRAELLESAKFHLSPYGTITIDAGLTPVISSYPAVAVTITSDW